jgi:hypothetical protein
MKITPRASIKLNKDTSVEIKQNTYVPNSSTLMSSLILTSASTRYLQLTTLPIFLPRVFLPHYIENTAKTSA